MSYSLVSIYGSLPRTTRGSFTVLGSDPKGKNFLYVNGNSVFIRNIEQPFLDCDVYTEHAQQVHCAKYSPSGFYIASADHAGKVRIWDTVNKEHLLKNEFQPISGTIKDLQWSSDNQRIIVGGEGREKFGHVFSSDTGTSTGEIMGTSKAINSVDFKPTRPFRAVVASEDNSICYFEGPPFKWKRSLNEHERFVNVVRYSPNGEKFASGGADGKLIIFDGKSGDKLNEVTNSGQSAHAGSIFSLCWDPSSKYILTASGDKTARVWDIDSNSLVKEFKFGDLVDDQQVGCLWQGSYLLSVALSGQIHYLNFNNASADQSILRTLKGHSKSITALEVAHVNSDKPIIFSGSHEGLIIHWDANSGQMDSVQNDTASQHKNQVQAIKFDSTGNCLVTCGLDDTVKFVDVNDFKYIKELKLDSQPQGIDCDQNSQVVVACISKLVLIKNKEIVASFNLNYESTSVSIGNRNQVAVGGKDNKVHIYQIENNQFKETQTLQERDFITAVKYSNNDEYLAVADNAKNVKCYKIDSASYSDITRDLWQHHAGRITSMAWSPDSNYLATSSVDTHCFIYSPSKVMSFIQIKNAHPLNPLTAVAWLNNTHVVTSSQDCCIRKWKLNF